MRSSRWRGAGILIVIRRVVDAGLCSLFIGVEFALLVVCAQRQRRPWRVRVIGLRGVTLRGMLRGSDTGQGAET